MTGLILLDNALRRALLLAALTVVSCAAHAGWSVADAVPGKAECVLETEEISLFDGASTPSFEARGRTQRARRTRPSC